MLRVSGINRNSSSALLDAHVRAVQIINYYKPPKKDATSSKDPRTLLFVKNRKFIETQKQKQTLKARLNRCEINPNAKKRKMSKMLSLYVIMIIIASAWTSIFASCPNWCIKHEEHWNYKCAQVTSNPVEFNCHLDAHTHTHTRTRAV